MCMVSVLSEAYRTQVPYVPLSNWPPQQIIDLSEVVKKLDSIDKKLGFADCKDSEKEAFLADLAKRLEVVEIQLGIRAEGEST